MAIRRQKGCRDKSVLKNKMMQEVKNDFIVYLQCSNMEKGHGMSPIRQIYCTIFGRLDEPGTIV